MVRQKGLTFNGLADEVVLEGGAEIRFSILLFSAASIPILGPWKFRDKSWGCQAWGGEMAGGSFLFPSLLDNSSFLFFSSSPTPFQKSERNLASERFRGTT